MDIYIYVYSYVYICIYIYTYIKERHHSMFYTISEHNQNAQNDGN